MYSKDVELEKGSVCRLLVRFIGRSLENDSLCCQTIREGVTFWVDPDVYVEPRIFGVGSPVQPAGDPDSLWVIKAIFGAEAWISDTIDGENRIVPLDELLPL